LGGDFQIAWKEGKMEALAINVKPGEEIWSSHAGNFVVVVKLRLDNGISLLGNEYLISSLQSALNLLSRENIRGTEPGKLDIHGLIKARTETRDSRENLRITIPTDSLPDGKVLTLKLWGHVIEAKPLVILFARRCSLGVTDPWSASTEFSVL